MIPWGLVNLVVADRMFGDTHLFGPDDYPTKCCAKCKKFRGVGKECGGGYSYSAGKKNYCSEKEEYD